MNNQNEIARNHNSGILSEKWKHQCKSISEANILIAEDNATNQLLMQKYIQLCGLNCKVASNGKEAIELLNHFTFDLILMDVHMPEIDGIEATLLIRKQKKFKDLPIIALTAEFTKKEKEEACAAGMNDFASKPLDISMLIEILTRWIIPAKVLRP